jgi:flagella basal body P-ring formation protein FlgA
MIRLILFGTALALTAPAFAFDEEPVAEARLVQMLDELVDEPDTRIDVPELPLTAKERADHTVRFSVNKRNELNGAVPVQVIVLDGDVRRRAFVVTAHVSRMHRVLVTRRKLPARQILTADDFVVEKRTGRLPRDIVEDPRKALGLRTRRRLSAGVVLRTTQLDKPPDISRGDRVRLYLESGGLTIETAGKAQQDGFVGDWLRVRNPSSRRVVIGQLKADGAIHVQP